MHTRYSSLNLQYILIPLLAFLISACRAQTSVIPSSTYTPPPGATTTLAATNIATATAAHTPTASLSPVPTLKPTLTPTPTPYPPEKLSFIEVTAPVNEPQPDYHLVLINSDGTGYETVDFLTPYLLPANPDIPVGDYLEWSADGRYLAFIGGNGGIDVADFDTQQVVHVDGSCNFGVSWSPDSRHLVVAVSYRRGDDRIKGSLYIYDTHTSSLERLTHDDSYDFFPSWSPDGQWIAFFRTLGDTYPCYDEGCDNGLYLIRPDGSEITLLHKGVYSGLERTPDPVWSPDSQWLVIRIFELGNRLVSISGEVRDAGVSFGMPTWSPNGNYLLFENRQGAQGEYADIFTIKTDGSGLMNLTQSPVDEMYPVWSLSGRYIAYGYYDAQTNTGSICVMYSDGSNVVCLRPGSLVKSWVP
jgi:hypothetical protein